MTRVWSMASQRSYSDQDCAQIENSIVYVCADPPPPRTPYQQSAPVPTLNALMPLPPDNDSGYEASPSSATRLATFQYESPSETSIDLLSIDMYFAPILLYENDVFDENQNQNLFDDQMDRQTDGMGDSPMGLRSEESSVMTSGQSSSNFAQDMRRSQPIPIPTPLPLPSPMSSISMNSGLFPTSERHSITRSHFPQPLPDVVNVEVRMRSVNGHIQARRAVSVSLPIDAEMIRSVGMSLRRISEEFEISTSRTTILSTNCGPASNGFFSNMLASIGLSRRRSLGSDRNQRNGRQRSFSTNDATQQ